MLSKIVLYALLGPWCNDPEIINHTTTPVSKFDLEVLESAKTRCGQIYPDAPCVKKFYIRGDQSYWVICGEEKPKK